ncbi:MAG: chemotaxis protein CheW [Candidatus Latescibacteria bacterium]|nr:chemotaxis protein CheW [Candidatus Latescibacterota bacterium]
MGTLETTTSRGGQYLTFFLGEEEYGCEILKVQEIIGIQGITSVPRTPDFIRGVINLRGQVVPVLDLRLKFDMSAIDTTSETCIIVVKAQDIQMGVQVDRVSEVVDIFEDDIEDVPEFGADLPESYLLGLGKSGSQVKLLLNIDNIITFQEAAALKQAAETDQPSNS